MYKCTRHALMLRVLALDHSRVPQGTGWLSACGCGGILVSTLESSEDVWLEVEVEIRQNQMWKRQSSRLYRDNMAEWPDLRHGMNLVFLTICLHASMPMYSTDIRDKLAETQK